MAVAIVLALPFGIVAAVRRGTWIDTFTGLLSLSGISAPTPWLGPIALYLFYVVLAWLPGPADTEAPLALFLPSLVVGAHLMAMLSRMIRSSLLDVLREDYMTTARAKGLSEPVVILRHGVRNALLPVITVVGLQFGSLLGGTIVIEKVFSRPGLGINTRNYPLVQGTVLVISVCYVGVNLLVDLAYGLADPRVRRA
jgi:ABC-type dipeptide/oligopeptide/nickel transport system permease component